MVWVWLAFSWKRSLLRLHLLFLRRKSLSIDDEQTIEVVGMELTSLTGSRWRRVACRAVALALVAFTDPKRTFFSSDEPAPARSASSGYPREVIGEAAPSHPADEGGYPRVPMDEPLAEEG